MADPIKKDEAGDAPAEEQMVEVPMSLLKQLQEDVATAQQSAEEAKAQAAGAEEMARTAGSDNALASGEPKLREKKNFEPKFRVARLRRFPMGGDIEKQGYVVGWTSRGAYQKVDKTGVSPQMVDYIQIFFLGHERDEKGVLQAEEVRLLDLLNAPQVTCKIVDSKKEEVPVPTGEEIDVLVFDPQHGMQMTGETIDGVVTHSEMQYKLSVPGYDGGDVWVDAEYLN